MAGTTKVKEDSIAGFITSILFNPVEGDRHMGPMAYLTRRSNVKNDSVTLRIKNDVGIEPGDKVIFEVTEYTNVTQKEITGSIDFTCHEYDDVSYKLIKDNG